MQLPPFNSNVQETGDTELSVNDDLAPELQPPMEELDVPMEVRESSSGLSSVED